MENLPRRKPSAASARRSVRPAKRSCGATSRNARMRRVVSGGQSTIGSIGVPPSQADSTTLTAPTPSAPGISCSDAAGVGSCAATGASASIAASSAARACGSISFGSGGCSDHALSSACRASSSGMISVGSSSSGPGTDDSCRAWTPLSAAGSSAGSVKVTSAETTSESPASAIHGSAPTAGSALALRCASACGSSACTGLASRSRGAKACRGRRRSHQDSAAMNTIPRMRSVQRSSDMGNTGCSDGREPDRLVDVDGHEPRDAGLVHGYAEKRGRQLHGRLVVGDEDELHAVGHVAHDIAEAADVVLIERRVDLIEQAEGRGIQVEDREHQRDGGKCLLAAGQQVDAAVLLAGRAGHDGDARVQGIVAHELEVRVPAAEEPRKALLQTGVDALESLLEARARLLVAAPHRLLDGVERGGQVVELPIQVLLALGLLLELVDRGEVDLAEPLDARARLGEPVLPCRDRRIGREGLLHFRELEARLRELLGERLAPDTVLLRGEPRRLHGFPRLADPTLGEHTLLIEHTQRRVGFLQRAASRCELRLGLEPPGESFVEALRERVDRGIAAGELRFQRLALLLELPTLLDHASEADLHRRFGRAARLDADEEVARGDLRHLSARTRPGKRFAAHLALAFELFAPQIEIRADHEALLERLAGTAETLLRGGQLSSVLGSLRLDTLAAQRRFLRAGAGGLELPGDVGVAAVRGLNAGLRRITLGLRLIETLAHGVEPILRLAHVLFRALDRGAQALEAVLALDHAEMMIHAAADAQPVTAQPLPAASDDGLTRGKRPAALQRLREGFRGEDAGELREHGGGSGHFRCQGGGGDLRARAVVRTDIRFDERHAPASQPLQRRREVVEAVDTHGLEVVAERGLDRQLPTRLHLQRLSDACAAGEADLTQPFRRLAGACRQGGLLHGCERSALRSR